MKQFKDTLAHELEKQAASQGKVQVPTTHMPFAASVVCPCQLKLIESTSHEAD